MIATSRPAAATIRAAAYCRKSVERGLDQEFNSIDAQREACAAFIASHRADGWVAVAERFEDGGFSGSTTERPAWKRLMGEVEAGTVDLIVVTRTDRLTRSLPDFVKIIDFLDRNGASFVSVSESFDTSTPSGRAFLHMLMTFAQWERETIGERTRQKVVAARRKGKWTGGVPVLGFALVDGRLQVNQAESLRVTALAELYLDTGSLTEAAREANGRGWRTKSWTTSSGHQRGGGPFTANTLHRLLTNPVLIGRVRCSGDTVDGEHDAILDPAVFDDVQRRLRSNGHRRAGGPRTRNSEAFLAGLIHCSACGTPMQHSFSTKANRRYRYYVCKSTRTDGWGSCSVKSVGAGDVEQLVLAEVRDAISSDEKLLAAVAAEVHRQRRVQIREMKRELRIAELEARPAANGDAPDTDRRIEKLRRDLAALEADRIADAEVVEAVAEFEPVWDAMTYAERTQVVRAVVEQVTYDGDSVEITLAEEAPSGR